MSTSKLSVFVTNSRRILSCYKYNFLELLAVKSNLFHNYLINMRKPVFLKEIDMAEITSKDRILLIGAGIFPSETVLIAETTNAKIVGIDNCKNAVKLAKKYVNKKQLNDKVIIKYADGVDFPIKDFDVIFIAINVYPIDSVLMHLSKNVEKGTKIMCKSIKNDIEEIIKKLKLEDTFIISKKIENPKSQSFLLKKIK